MNPTVDYQRLFERAPTSLLVLDRFLRIVAANDAYLGTAMTTRAALVGRDLFEVFPENPSDPGGEGVRVLRESLKTVLASRQHDAMAIVRYDLPAADGFTERYWSSVNTPVLDAAGDVSLIIHRADDVSEFVRASGRGRYSNAGAPLADDDLDVVRHASRLQEANRNLLDAQRRLRRIAGQQAVVAALGQYATRDSDPAALMGRAAAAVVELPEVSACEIVELRDDDVIVVRASARESGNRPASAAVAHDAAAGEPAASAPLAHDAAPLIRRALNQDSPVVVSDLPGGEGVESLIPAAHLGVGSAMAVGLGGRGGPYGALVAYSPARGAFDQEDGAFLSSVANVLGGAIEGAQREEEMRRQALYDELTGLPNRKLLMDRLGRALARSRRDGGGGALALLDLDGFKPINDTYGHDAGDQVLRQAAERLTAALRSSDTVARLGGDEFALLLADVATREEADCVAGKILQALREPMHADDHEVRMDASIGFALHPVHGDDERVLLRRADAAMYVAKRAGNGHAVYTTEHDDSRMRRRGEVMALRGALGRSELTVHYQPKMALADMSVCGVEALVRWQHPDRGLLAPDRFIALAEESGLIRALTLEVLDTALEQARCWRLEGIEVPVSVNLAESCLHDPSLGEMAAARLEAAGVPPSGLEFEVAESAVMKRPGAALVAIDELSAAGIRTAVDDFGIGRSSLAYLERLPVHELKIDKSLLLDPAGGGGDGGLVRAVIDLAHNFDLAVVAEGIETPEVCRALLERGCDRGQGFHLQGPLPAAEMTAWLRRHTSRPANAAG